MLPIASNPSGFRFSLTNAAFSAGTSSPAEIQLSELSATGSIPLGNYALRPGAAPVTLTLSNSAPDVVKVAPSVTLYETQALTSVHLSGLAKGTASIALSTPTGYTKPASSTTLTVTIQ